MRAASDGQQSLSDTGGAEQPYLRATLDRLHGIPGSEITKYCRQCPDVLFLGIGEGSWPTPGFIQDAMIQATQSGQTFYGPILGHHALRVGLSSYYADVYGLDIPVSRLAVTSSGTAAVAHAFAAILDVGDEVVAVTPIWKNLLGTAILQGASVCEVALDPASGPGGGWGLDLQRLFDAVTPKTRAIIINSPSNPTGWVMPGDQIREVMAFARARGIWVVSDEVYGRFLYEGVRAPSFLDHAYPDDRLFVINSFSKNYAMTGWRLGWLVMPPAAETAIYDLILYGTMGAPNFLQHGAIAALRHGEPFIAEQIAHCRTNLDLLCERVAAMPRVQLLRPEATFYSMLRVEGEPDCMRLARRMIDEVGLGLAPGCAFGAGAHGWLRLCFAVSQDKLSEALDRLERFVLP